MGSNFIIIKIILLISSTFCAIVRADYVRACYYASWAIFREGTSKYLPEKYIPGLCTHIVYAFGWMNEDFTAKAYDPSDTPSDSQPNGYYARVNALKDYDHQLKTILSFGGRSFPYKLFQGMMSNSENRHTFISTAIVWARKHKFDGIDIDWNNPSGEEDKQNLAIFLKELMEAAMEESRGGWSRLIITAVVEAKREVVTKTYDIKAMAKYVDFVFVRSFDFQFAETLEPKTGFNAPLYGSKNESDEHKKYWNVADAVKCWVEGKMPNNKIVIGIPIFGRGWTLKDPKNQKSVGTPAHAAKPRRYTKSAGAAAYHEICVMLANGAQRFFDDETKSPYLIADGDQWFSYDDAESIRIKLDWLREKGLAGTYVWSLDYDDFNDLCPDSKVVGRYPLIGTIARELGNVRTLGAPVEVLGKQKHCVCSLLFYNEEDGGIYLSKYLSILIAGVFFVMAFSTIFACIFTIFLFKLRTSRFAHGSAGFMMDIKAYWHFTPIRSREIDPTMVDIEKMIYSGPNSRVYFARYRFAEDALRNVVVKVPSKDAFQMHTIIEETRINAKLRHPRVVEYIGFYRDAFGDMRIVSEFMAGGDLHSYLVDWKNIVTVGHILNFLRQIIEGMEYLMSKRIIHRDLAARNCMLDRNFTQIKISDFGLSRHFGTDTTYSCSSPVRLPLRWIAAECFDEGGEIFRNCKFSEKTDVWAFGVVIWECFSRGAQPYEEEDFKKVLPLLKGDLDHQKRIWRLPRPLACPEAIYDNLMLKCWAAWPEERPTFSAIRTKLEGTFEGIMADQPDLIVQNVSLKQ